LLWLSDNVLVLINIVTLRRARLVPGWVTVLGRVNHVSTGSQVNSACAIPPWVEKWVLFVVKATVGEARGVLRKSRSCDQDCWHTGL